MKVGNFTGHRTKELLQSGFTLEQIRAKLYLTIEKLIVEKGFDAFISGGAIGIDQMAYYCVAELKKKYPHIRNIVAVPYEDQPKGWEEACASAERKMKQSEIGSYTYNDAKKQWKELTMVLEEYKNMLVTADEVVYVDTVEGYIPRGMKPSEVGRHSNIKMQLRNIYMVDRSELVIAVYNGVAKGGTFNCITYAKGKKDILCIDLTNGLKYKMIA